MAPGIFRSYSQAISRNFWMLMAVSGWCVSHTVCAQPTSIQTCSRVITIAASPLGKSILVSDKGEVSGVTPLVFDRMAADTGCQFQWVVMPRTRAFHQLREGTIDLVTDAVRTPQRDDGARFVESGSTIPALVSLRSRPAQAENMEILLDGPLTLITVRGYDYGPGYRALLEHPSMAGRIFEATAPDNAFKMLLGGRAHAILIAPSAISESWERFGNNEPIFVSEVRGMPALPFGLYMSDHMAPEDRAIIEASLRKLLRSGEVAKLSEGVYPAGLKEAMRPLIKINTAPKR